MTTESSHPFAQILSSRAIPRGAWPTTLTRVARVAVAIPAFVGVFAWLTLTPILLLTFLFLQPLFVVGIVMFLIAAIFGGKTVVLHRYRAGDTVFTAGEPSDFIYLVRSGEFEGADTSSKTAQTLKFGPGDSFGMSSMLSEGRHAYTIKAMSDAEVIRVDPADLSIFIGEAPQLEKALQSVLKAHLENLPNS
jgi:CRP-like cAMP-binding protein